MKKTKTIPFNLETAKKIQAREIEGKIKYAEGDGYAYDADIIKFDLIANKAKAKPNSTLYRTVVAVVEFDNHQDVRVFNTDGYGYNSNGDDTKLFIEVPDNELQFKPFDRVLIRDTDNQKWHVSLYENHGNDGFYVLHGAYYKQCIPYEGHEYLVGTTDKPKED